MTTEKQKEKVQLQLEKLNKQKLEHEEKEKKEDERLTALKVCISDIIVNSDLHFVKENNLYFQRLNEQIFYETPEVGNIVVSTFRWSTATASALQTMYPELRGDNWYSFLNVLDSMPERKKMGVACGTSVQKSDLNMLYMDPIELIDSEPHWIFDVLLNSICGNKQENVDHLEKCLIHKRREPDCIFIPWIVLNDGGGTGKDLFAVTILSNLLGPWCCNPNLPMEQVVGKFGDSMEGKLIALINEKPEDGDSIGRLKSINGNKIITIEPKGRRSYTAQAMLWAVLTSNHSAGTVTLANNDSDRRYSIISGNKPLKYYVSLALDCSEVEAKQWIETKGQYILSDKKELGKWMNSIIQKHGSNVRVMEAMHGADYRSLLNIQKSLSDEVMERIFNSPNFDYVKRQHLFYYYLKCCEEDKTKAHLGKSRFLAQCDLWLEKNRSDIHKRLVKWLGSKNSPESAIETTAEVYVKDGCESFNKCNDFKYFIVNGDYGGKIWKI